MLHDLSFRVWKTVPEQHICTYEYKLAPPNPRPISGRFQLNFTLEVNGCESGTPVLYLEHVQVHATGGYSNSNLIFHVCTTFQSDIQSEVISSWRCSLHKALDLCCCLLDHRRVVDASNEITDQSKLIFTKMTNPILIFNNYTIYCRTSTATVSTSGRSCQCSSGARTLEARGYSWSRASPTIPLLLVCSTIPFLLFLHSSFSLLFLI